MPSYVHWEWRSDEDKWVSYEFADNTMIEARYAANDLKFKTTKLSFNAEWNTMYEYDLSSKTNDGTMVQRNTESGTVRKLRRLQVGTSDDDIGLLKAASLPDVSHMSSTHAGIEMSKKHARSESDDDMDGKKLHAASAAAAVPKASAATVLSYTVPDLPADIIASNKVLGAQSLRKQKYDLGPHVSKDPHGKSCFDCMLRREKQLCGEWAVFYHSYSFAALLYEVQAAVAAVLFRFKAEFASLPRLLKKPFLELPDAAALQKIFPTFKDRDHNPKFRAVGLSGTTSLLAEDSEAPPKNIFLQGYSCSDLSFVGVLENLLESCSVPKTKTKDLAQEIISLSTKHGLDTTQFKGKACKSGRAGHMLQIFIKRNLVNQYCYAAHPFGVTDKARPDLAKHMQGDGPIKGQVRIVANPSAFMRAGAVRMYVYSADQTFHDHRSAYQKEMAKLLDPIIGTPAVRTRAAEGIYGGKLPQWFQPDDYENQKMKVLTTTTGTAATAATSVDATGGWPAGVMKKDA